MPSKEPDHSLIRGGSQIPSVSDSMDAQAGVPQVHMYNGVFSGIEAHLSYCMVSCIVILLPGNTNTVDSCYLEFQETLKYFEISVLRTIRFAELGGKLIRLTTFNKYMCNWTPEVRDLLKILWKRGAISPLFHNIFLPVVRFSCLSRDKIFTLR